MSDFDAVLQKLYDDGMRLRDEWGRTFVANLNRLSETLGSQQRFVADLGHLAGGRSAPVAMGAPPAPNPGPPPLPESDVPGVPPPGHPLHNAQNWEEWERLSAEWERYRAEAEGRLRS